MDKDDFDSPNYTQKKVRLTGCSNLSQLIQRLAKLPTVCRELARVKRK